MTAGRGADIVFELTGSPAVLRQAFQMVARGGRIVDTAGSSTPPTEIAPFEYFYRKQVDVLGLNGRDVYKTWYRAFRILGAKMMDLTDVVTHRLPLEDAAEAFDLLDKGRACKVILNP